MKGIVSIVLIAMLAAIAYCKPTRGVLGAKGGEKGIRLPYDAEVEYLESTGTQWIDTGMIPSASTSFELRISGGATNYTNWAMGAQTWVGVHHIASPSQIGVCNASSTAYKAYASYDGSLTTIKLNGSVVSVNNIPIGEISRRDATSSLHLFGYYNTATSSTLNFRDGRIHYVRFFGNGVLVRDFIPVRFTNELGLSEGAMYDRISGQLFRNQGTGAFSYGPDVKGAK